MLKVVRLNRKALTGVLVVTAVLCGFLLLSPAPCQAHLVQVGIGTQSWVFLNGSEVDVIFNAGYSYFTAAIEMKNADKEGDNSLSPDEVKAFCDKVLAQVTTGVELWIDGRLVPLELAGPSHTTLKPGDIVLTQLDFWFRFRAECRPSGSGIHAIRYREKTFPIDRVQSIIYVPHHPGFRFVSVPGAVDTCMPALMRGSEFLIVSDGIEFEYKQIPGFSNMPLFSKASGQIPREILPEGAEVGRAVGAAAPEKLEAADSRSTAQRILEDWLNVDSYTLFLLGLLLTALWGAWHAFTPGHGKSMVAAYLIGSKGRFRDAVFLGVTVTITHTGIIFLTVILLLLGERFWADPSGTRTHNTVMLVTGIASGAILWAMGAFLFYRRWNRAPAASAGVDGTHSHVHAGSANGHSHDHSHGHSHEHLDGAAHAKAHAGSVSWWTLLTLGISGGIIPCPAAITIFFFSWGQLNNLRLGLAFLISFSIGLGFILTGIGIALIASKNILSAVTTEGRFISFAPGFRNRFGAALDRVLFALGRRLPGLSAVFIMLLGNYMLLNTLFVMGVIGK